MKKLICKLIPFIGVVLMMLIFINCQQDDIVTKEEIIKEIDDMTITAKHVTVDDIPNIMNFLNTKTNNTLKVDLSGEKIRLTNTSQTTRITALGTIETNKVVQVENENNTKYTFNVKNEENPLNKTNLIVVSIDGVLVEYFIKYIIDPDNPPNQLNSGAVDMTTFTGSLEFFDMDGNQMGAATIVDGVTVSGSGFATPPCPDNANNQPDDTDNADDDDSGNNTSGGAGDADWSDGTTDEGDYGGNTNGGSTGGGGWIADSEGGCTGLSWSYGDCGCGPQYANGHAQTDNSCCNGSPLIVTSCDGSSWTSGRTGGLEPDPCADGDVGVIFDDDEELVSDCNNLTSLSISSSFQEKMEELQTATTGNTEIMYYGRNDSSGDMNYEDSDRHEGVEGAAEVELPLPTSSIDSFIHNHFNQGTGVLPSFSGGDLVTLYSLYTSGNINDIGDFVMTVITPGSDITSAADDTVYAMVINNETDFAAFGNLYLQDDLIIDSMYKEFNINENISTELNELGLLNLLKESNLGLTLYRGDANNLNNWTRLKLKNNGTVRERDCN